MQEKSGEGIAEYKAEEGEKKRKKERKIKLDKELRPGKISLIFESHLRNVQSTYSYISMMMRNLAHYAEMDRKLHQLKCCQHEILKTRNKNKAIFFMIPCHNGRNQTKKIKIHLL